MQLKHDQVSALSPAYASAIWRTPFDIQAFAIFCPLIIAHETGHGSLICSDRCIAEDVYLFFFENMRASCPLKFNRPKAEPYGSAISYSMLVFDETRALAGGCPGFEHACASAVQKRGPECTLCDDEMQSTHHLASDR